MPPISMSLTQLSPGQVAHVAPADVASQLGTEDASLLRAMGLKPNASVCLCRLGDPCIVQVGHIRGDSCRLGLARRIADRLTVCLAPQSAATPSPRA